MAKAKTAGKGKIIKTVSKPKSTKKVAATTRPYYLSRPKGWSNVTNYNDWFWQGNFGKLILVWRAKAPDGKISKSKIYTKFVDQVAALPQYLKPKSKNELILLAISETIKGGRLTKLKDGYSWEKPYVYGENLTFGKYRLLFDRHTANTYLEAIEKANNDYGIKGLPKANIANTFKTKAEMMRWLAMVEKWLKRKLVPADNVMFFVDGKQAPMPSN